MSKKIILLLAFIFIFISFPTTATEPSDISNHWAQDYILNLTENGVLETYPDGTFRPDQAITRGEFALAIARELNLLPNSTVYFQDLQDYPGGDYINSLVEQKIINGYPDNTFKPNQTITRAEITAIIMKSLGVDEKEKIINLDDYKPFQDVASDHWASDHIKLAAQIGLIQGNELGNFEPKRNASRAEAAKLINKFAELFASSGYITDVYPTSQKVSINFLNGQREVLSYSDETIVGRNNRIVDLEEILKTDKVFVISQNSNLKYVKAYGMVTQEDLAAEISTMTGGTLDSDEVKQLSTGNLDFLKPKLQTTIKERLLAEGLTSDEVNAIMSTNWDQLETLSKDRLAEAIAIETSLPLDITRSLLTGDWEKLKSYAQIELIQRIVQEVINSDLIS